MTSACQEQDINLLLIKVLSLAVIVHQPSHFLKSYLLLRFNYSSHRIAHIPEVRVPNAGYRYPLPISILQCTRKVEGSRNNISAYYAKLYNNIRPAARVNALIILIEKHVPPVAKLIMTFSFSDLLTSLVVLFAVLQKCYFTGRL